MEKQNIVDRLEQKALKPTANRLLVYEAVAEQHRPISLADLETKLAPMDRSSIFRVLTLFVEHDVLHVFEDGRGVLNYELCEHDGACNHSDAHIHFYCESCCQSFCLDDVDVSALHLPADFSPHSISFVIKGECAACRKKHSAETFLNK